MLKQLVSIAVTILVPTLLQGQACFSSPGGGGTVALELSRTQGPDSDAYGIGARPDFRGPITAFVGYRLLTSDTLHSEGQSLVGGVAGELVVDGISLCAGVTPMLTSHREPEALFDELGALVDLREQTQRTTRFPIEVSAGKLLNYRGLMLTPSFGAAHVSESRRVRSSRPLESSKWFLETRLALSVGYEKLLGRMQVTRSTAGSADPMMSVTLGVLID